MGYEVKVSKEARAALASFETEVRIRILRKLESIRFSPYSFLEKYIDSSLWKLRVGDYRVIIEIDEKNKSINAVTAGHRKNLYKKK